MECSFGTRLRSQREQQQIPLADIAERTKIKLSLLDALERGDVSLGQTAIFRRSFVRAYAQAIGLDADAVLRDPLPIAEHERVVVVRTVRRGAPGTLFDHSSSGSFSILCCRSSARASSLVTPTPAVTSGLRVMISCPGVLPVVTKRMSRLVTIPMSTPASSITGRPETRN